MPIMKKADGWYWGSKGPFDTKQKAVQVGQAAHAAGADDGESAIVKEKKYGQKIQKKILGLHLLLFKCEFFV